MSWKRNFFIDAIINFMKILIVGAGIAGLSLGAYLHKQSHEITIIEKDAHLDRKGYAIVLYYNGLKTLESLGIIEDLKKNSHIYTKVCFRDSKGAVLKEVDYIKLLKTYGPSLLILRQELRKRLLNLNKYSHIKMGLTITGIQENEGGVTATFSDKKQEVFDIVIGADGVGSSVRELSFTKQARKFFGGEYWTAIISGLPSYNITYPNLLFHKDKHFMIYPFDNSEKLCLTFGRIIPKNITNRSSSVGELRSNFADFGYFVPEILKKLPSYETMYHGFVSEVVLPQWYKKRIVLVGDAAHAMHPITGMGTSMVLEDTCVLAEELKKVNKDTIMSAFKNYDERRKKRVENVQKSARAVG